MKIEKSKNVIGLYNASGYFNGYFLTVSAYSLKDAIDSLFNLIYWNLGIERPISYEN